MTLKQDNSEAEFTVDKRRYFRIDDEIGLLIKSLDDSKSYEELQNYYDEKIAGSELGNEVEYEDDKFTPLLKVIQNKYPEIHEYIQHLEHKMNILSQRYENEKQIDDSDTDLTKVNISASGMNFINSEKYEKGQFIELYITLYPTKKRIYLIAKILRVNVLSIDKSSTSMEFVIISDANKEILIKHIHAKQLEDLNNHNV